MKLPKSKCPRCNSWQKFGRQIREVENNEHEIFIRCSVCRWEQVAIRGQLDKIRSNKRREQLKIRAAKDPSLLNVLRRMRKKNE